jgi:hypothetical protein
MYWLDAWEDVEGGLDMSRPIEGKEGLPSVDGVETRQGRWSPKREECMSTVMICDEVDAN